MLQLLLISNNTKKYVKLEKNARFLCWLSFTSGQLPYAHIVYLMSNETNEDKELPGKQNFIFKHFLLHQKTNLKNNSFFLQISFIELIFTYSYSVLNFLQFCYLLLLNQQLMAVNELFNTKNTGNKTDEISFISKIKSCREN